LIRSLAALSLPSPTAGKEQEQCVSCKGRGWHFPITDMIGDRYECRICKGTGLINPHQPDTKGK
jgi:DnaJ-class molecular chaperone